MHPALRAPLHLGPRRAITRPLPTRNLDHDRTSAPRLLRHAADGQPASRQLSRCAPELGRDAKDARVHFLRRRPARHHGRMAGSGRAQGVDPAGCGRLYRVGHRSEEEHRLQSKPGAGACGAGLDLQLRRPPGLAEPHDAVQGEGRQGPRERVGRPLCLSEPDGRRHSGLPRHARARRARTKSSIWNSRATSPRSSTTTGRTPSWPRATRTASSFRCASP